MPHPVTLRLAPPVVAERIRARVPNGVRDITEQFIILEPEHAYHAMQCIRDDEVLDGKFLVQMCSVDRITSIEVVYHFSSLAQNHIFEVKVPADHERPIVPSIASLWVGATLQEREIYDLMGVEFAGHEGLSRLFLWDTFPGHPLRKDFMSLPGGQKPGLSQFPKQTQGQSGGEFRPKNPGTGE